VDPLRAAVIGLGIGRRHIQAYQALPGVEVAAVVDADSNALINAQREFGIAHGFTDYRQLLERADIDLVSICTPDRLHAGQALAALDAGKHVLCEKPLATRSEDAIAIVHKAHATGRTFMVCHNYRFMPQFARLRQLAQAGEVGELFYAGSSYIQDLYFMEALGPDYWRLKDPQDFYLGGAIHNVDLLRWVMGEIVEVHAYATHVMPFYPIDDNYVTNVRFADGRIGQLLLILGARLKDKFLVELEVYGAEGALKATLQQPAVILNRDRAPGDQPQTIATPSANGHEQTIAHFVECVRRGEEPAITAVDGARAVAVCEAAIRSAREGKPVHVEPIPA
jgi:UDP-N-acetylglucosamine 3-dehydrogenase